MSLGTLYGVGVGPGDPELITLKAARLLKGAALVAYIVSPSGRSMAREIVRDLLGEQRELPIPVPMQKARQAANAAYDAAAEQLREVLGAGRDALVLCEGDPLFYGSFIYLHERLGADFPCEIVPGITAFAAGAAWAQLPLTRLDQRLAVLSSRNDDDQIGQALREFDSVVLMKAGPARARLLSLIEASGRWDDTVYLERVGWGEERIVRDLAALPAESGPYFSMFITTRAQS